MIVAVEFIFFFFNDTATTEIYTLSLHDALPISKKRPASRSSTRPLVSAASKPALRRSRRPATAPTFPRSEEHTSELQSLTNLVCRLLLEKKKKKIYNILLIISNSRHDDDSLL